MSKANQKKADPFFEHYRQLLGKTVARIIVGGVGENASYGLLFQDGTKAWIDCDPEGNGPGFLSIETPPDSGPRC